MQEANTTDLNKKLKELEERAKIDVSDYFSKYHHRHEDFRVLMNRSLTFINTLVIELPKGTDAQFPKKYNEVLEAILTQSPESHESYIEIVKRRTSKKKTIIEKDLKALRLKKLSNNISLEVKNENGLKGMIYIGTDVPARKHIEKIEEGLKSLNSYFSYGGILSYASGDRFEILNSIGQLDFQLRSKFDFFDGQHEDGRIKYCSPATPLVRSLTESKEFSSNFKKIKTLSYLPSFDDKFTLLKDGYNEESFTFQLASKVKPILGHDNLHSLLEDFQFESKADFANVVGYIASLFINNNYNGSRPALCVSAPGRKYGKSTLAYVIATLMSPGSSGATMSLSKNEEEMEKRFAGELLSGRSSLIFDNIKMSKEDPEISSSFIERLITDPEPSFRLLGGNRIFSIRNNLNLIFTLNNGYFSEDLATRFLYVNLTYDGNINERIFKSDDIKKDAQVKSDLILGELLNMWLGWIKAGRPTVRIPGRFSPWATAIASMLSFNDIHGFMENTEVASAKRDPLLKDFLALIGLCEPGLVYKSKDLLQIAADNKLFPSIFENKDPAVRAVQLGKTLNKYSENCNDSGEVVLRLNIQQKGSGNSSDYTVLEQQK